MLKDFVEIVGINSVDEFPIIGPLDRYTQFTVKETLSIPEAKPDVEQITSMLIYGTITNFSTIATPTGVKVIINGELNQKIIYTADEPTQSVHSAHYVEPFCTFIEIPLVIPAGQNVIQALQALGITLEDVIVGDPKILIEDVSVKLVDPRTIKKCVILFTWVALNPILTPLLPPV